MRRIQPAHLPLDPSRGGDQEGAQGTGTLPMIGRLSQELHRITFRYCRLRMRP